jgi:N-acetylglucosamine-6-phosphate deacetylase
MSRSDTLEACIAHGGWWLLPEEVFNGQAICANRAIRICNDQIVSTAPADRAGKDGAPVFYTSGLASPGFVDLQLNGGGGVLFNAMPNPEGLSVIAAAHRKGGTTSFLPTLITDAPHIMEKAADAVIASLGTNGIVGIHLEGPHISIDRKGAHNPSFIRPIDAQTFDIVDTLRSAKVPVLLTLAPECVPQGTIARLCEMGVVVSLGHTAADAATTRQAIAEGATSATHLYNAMTPITARDAGVVGAVLESEIFCGFIADGYHVDDAVLRLAMRSRSRQDRMVVVSDAMPTWGGPDQYELYGETIALTGGRLVNRSGSLAGVHIDLSHSVRRLVHNLCLDRAAALAMATRAPATLMGFEATIGGLRPLSRADLVVLDDELRPTLVLQAGRAQWVSEAPILGEGS